jgi:hypothetical protein
MRVPKGPLPMVVQGILAQGLSPGEMALTVSLGLTLGTLPLVLGTSMLCFLTASRLKLNHPAIQLANYLSWPLQVVLFLPFFRLGNTLFHAGPLPSSFDALLRQVQGDWEGTLRMFGWANLQAIGAWCLAVPFFCGLLYLFLFFLVGRISPKSKGFSEPAPRGRKQ